MSDNGYRVMVKKKYRVIRTLVGTAMVSAAACLVLVFGAFMMNSSEQTPDSQWELADRTTPMPTDPEPDGTFAPEEVPSEDPTDPDASPGSPDQDKGEPGGSGPGVPEEDTDKRGGPGVLNMSLPAQAGLSMGVIGLAFLALLPGRKMPDYLRH
ncbi:hypothetical protein [Natronoglycomyces albus]|uniref:Uncharacterized protein n=1 Tax=Natronoglycomyces albus TaxID=2811108 RepID=A0A895XRI0_9ACTN|nr:hypothetical protein [Natronoglycomyces albus]QSB05785.1 hypothetical protein JQS30_02305 [Natronoglycomyces albus]